MTPSLRRPSAEAVGRLLGAVAVLSASVAAGFLLSPRPLADAFFAGWVVVAVALAVVGGVGAWTNRRPVVWTTALLLSGLSVAGMWSIGFLIAPAALALLGAAVVLQVAGPQRDVAAAETVADTAAEPPTRSAALLKSAVGVGAAVVGASLVYFAAIERDLFGACAVETLACALDVTHWDRVAMTVPGLLAVGFGVWLVWRQVVVRMSA